MRPSGATKWGCRNGSGKHVWADQNSTRKSPVNGSNRSGRFGPGDRPKGIVQRHGPRGRLEGCVEVDEEPPPPIGVVAAVVQGALKLAFGRQFNRRALHAASREVGGQVEEQGARTLGEGEAAQASARGRGERDVDGGRIEADLIDPRPRLLRARTYGQVLQERGADEGHGERQDPEVAVVDHACPDEVGVAEAPDVRVVGVIAAEVMERRVDAPEARVRPEADHAERHLGGRGQGRIPERQPTRADEEVHGVERGLGREERLRVGRSGVRRSGVGRSGVGRSGVGRSGVRCEGGGRTFITAAGQGDDQKGDWPRFFHGPTIPKTSAGVTRAARIPHPFGRTAPASRRRRGGG